MKMLIKGIFAVLCVTTLTVVAAPRSKCPCNRPPVVPTQVVQSTQQAQTASTTAAQSRR